jgi:L-2-hydroxyglutarate oxidase LhgO
MLLNSRLKRLKADEHSLKAVIGELITATEIAERAIGGLKQTVRDVNEHLGNQLAAAGQMSQQLKQQLAEGDYVVRRLTKIAVAARPSNATEPEAKTNIKADIKADIKTDAPKVSAAKATAAAAQAFLDRKRSDGLAA